MIVTTSVDCVIVTYNSSRVIDGCLTSLLDSGVDPSRVYVVDNDSTDGTVAHVTRSYPGVNVIRSGGNLGFSKANNLGASKGSSEVLIFANPDVIFLPGAVRELAGGLTASRANGICGPLLIDEDLRVKPETYLPRTSVGDLFLQQTHLWKPLFLARRLVDETVRPKSLRGRGVLSGACMALRREDFARVGGFDERFFMYEEDIDLCERISQAGLKVVQAPLARVVHLGGGTYIGSRAVFFNAMRSREDHFLKSSGGRGSLVTKRLLVALGLFLRLVAFWLLGKRGEAGRHDELLARLGEALRSHLSPRRLVARKPLRFPAG